MISKRKDERHSYVIKRAEELAATGDFSGWLSIEIAIRGEGYSEARSILDSTFIREQLDQKCRIAQSEAEKENRALFIRWIKEFVSLNFNSLRQEFPGVKLSTRDNQFSIFNDKNQIDVHKAFSSRKLAGQLHFTETDGKQYITDYRGFVDKNFNEFTIDDLRSIIKIVTRNHS